MYKSSSVGWIVIIAAIIFGIIGYLIGDCVAWSESNKYFSADDKLIQYIKQTYPEQWQEIEKSRPYIEYDLIYSNEL